MEKPLCLTIDELQRINQSVIENPSSVLMVGFNRRYSSLIDKITTLLNQTTAPKCFIMTVNAGKIPASHWTQDR